MLASVLMIGAAAVRAAEADCELHFSLHGWSVLYKRAEGRGRVVCDNGQSMSVRIRVEGGGLTVGKHVIDDGRGKFSGVHDIREVLGAYAGAEAHAGAVKGGAAQVLTKGPVSLALSGSGRGWDLGIAFGRFEITAAK
ncbi:hypothetical protein MBSD_n1513 [Mizugakiibacter sediminis]|uniref:Secreted protein n=1 Tax=Mizugakiibacter sediminis TaxID=1475481 RepID=A0A0K8QMT4_9GAMM|nr:hypothetical protein [Mizugakiibacter sediminis]GAP66210.1 hypothetical protein MBSD_n1513 [Mizugakiibacter sediminis]